MTTVALAEDHVAYRQFTADFINSLQGFHVIYQASDGWELIEHIDQWGPPDLLMLDLNMRGMGGRETANWMKRNHPETKILVLTMYDDENVMVCMLKEGVRGFLTKNIYGQELHKALCHILKEGAYYFGHSNERLEKFVQYFSDKDADKTLLNDREIEFIKLACSEVPFRVLAEQMDVSPRTVDSLMNNVLRKLQLKSRTGLVMYAINSGIVYL